MTKIRVGQLAKELNLKVGEVLARLRELGAEVKSNLSTVEEDVATRLRSAVSPAEQRPAEGSKGGQPASVPFAGGRSTAKAAPSKQPAAQQGAPAGPPAAKAAPAGVRATSPAPAPKTSALKAQPIAPVKSAPKPLPPLPSPRPAAPPAR